MVLQVAQVTVETEDVVQLLIEIGKCKRVKREILQVWQFAKKV